MSCTISIQLRPWKQEMPARPRGVHTNAYSVPGDVCHFVSPVFRLIYDRWVTRVRRFFLGRGSVALELSQLLRVLIVNPRRAKVICQERVTAWVGPKVYCSCWMLISYLQILRNSEVLKGNYVCTRKDIQLEKCVNKLLNLVYYYY